MSDNNIPFEIQMEIIKWLPVKPLIQFRSVSKPWKSFIDSSKFIKGYGARRTQSPSRLLSYRSDYDSQENSYICLIDDDDIETFKVQQKKLAPLVVSPLLKQYHVRKVIGACHGLLCLYGWNSGYSKWPIIVIWNPSIRKSFGIVDAPLTHIKTDYGFGVCPVTKDPTLVKIKHKIKHRIGIPWHVEVFTLSSGVWNLIPSDNFPRQSVTLNWKTQVVIDRSIYWAAWERTFADDGEVTTNQMVVSFDLITKEFKVVDLPDYLRNELNGACVSLSKLRESLVVYGPIYVDGAQSCGVWVMEHDSSFRKIFTIGTCVRKILGFSKSGETIYEIPKKRACRATVDVYDPRSQQINNLGIFGAKRSFFMGSYKESLLLLDHSNSDFDIHYDDS